MKLSHQTPVRKEKALFETIHKTSNEAERGPSEIVLKRWEEAIFYENHIIPRTYHSAIVYNSMLYVFGGYEYNTGIMNDFYCIDLDSKDPFVWKAIEKSKGTYPGIFSYN